MESIGRCELCLETTNLSAKFTKPINRLWQYFYHQSFPETFPSSEQQNSNVGSLPTLSFSVSWGNSLADNKNIHLCGDCFEKVDKLDKMIGELEALKKEIDLYLQQIHNSSNSSHDQVSNNNLQSFMIRKGKSVQGVSLSGSSTGKENISQIVSFLGTICYGIPEKTCPLAQHPPPEPVFTLVKSESETAIPPEFSERTEESGALGISREENNFKANMDDPSNDMVYQEGYEDYVMESEYITKSFHEPNDIEISYPQDPLAENVVAKMANVSKSARPSETSTRLHCNKKSLSKKKTVSVPLSSSSQPTSLSSLDKICPICKKSIKKRHFSIHMRVHTGEKPYICEFCEKTFTQRSTLVRHRRIHTGETPFVCQLCPQRFNQGFFLKTHCLKAHGIDNLE